ncbi:hypothetical protein BaRGS_00010029 [Batillaria attramentaria]|uniref:G-protein coupled receptors family 2 profile 2 domain-containing protein n=1 Tax=Batillaria attramentaria TaxID=370345 RepID=A0ABD0LH33_9CAEN
MNTLLKTSVLPILVLSLLSFVMAPPTINTPHSQDVLNLLDPRAPPSPPTNETSAKGYQPPFYPPMTSSYSQHGRSTLPFPSSPPLQSPVTTRSQLFTPTTDEVSFWKQVAEAYFDYCGYSCESGKTGGYGFEKCVGCFCDDICFVYGDCCPDKYYHAGHGPRKDSLSRSIHCSRTSIPAVRSERVQMVTECPEDFNDPVTAARCKSDSPHWSFATPVTGKNTQLTFKNKYCVQCHSENDSVSWNVQIGTFIEKSMDAFSIYSTAEEKYLAALVSGDNYLIFFTNPIHPTPRGCEKDQVSECTNRLDAEVEKACLAFSAPSKSPRHPWTLYRNPFCYLCNTHSSWQELLREEYYEPPTDPLESIPLLVLLDFSSDNNDEESNKYESDVHFRDIPQDLPQCTESDYFDVHTNSCRKVLCAEGKERPANTSDGDTCRSIPGTTGHYGYELCLQTSMTDLQMASVVTSLSPTHLKNAFQWMTDEYGLELWLFDLFRLYPSFKGAGDVGLMDFVLYLQLFPSGPVDRDFLDESLIANMTKILERLDRDLNTSGLQIAASCSVYVLRDLVKMEANFTDPFLIFSVNARDFIRENAQNSNRVYESVGYEFSFLPLNKLLICPFVRFNKDDAIFDPKTQDLVVTYSGNNLSISIPDFYVDWRGVSVCLNQLKPQEKSENNQTKTEGLSALHVVSLVCTVISLLFLLVSFIVYCLLSELRHIAGINTMLLIVVLFWAQIFLQVASYADLIGWRCQAVGVATHFLWLCVVFAQNACTFHMFYTLSFPLRSHVANTKVRVMATRYIVYVLTASFVFVVAVLIWQFVSEDNSGYGGSACYIRKFMVRVTMFALPLAVTVLLNIAMFVFTIVRLRSLSQVGSTHTRSNRKNLLLYTKLSVFTGVTWLLGFLASALVSVALSYLFVVLQGCQGLFLFLAFLANKRVLTMLKALRREKEMGAARTHTHSDSQKPHGGSRVTSPESAMRTGLSTGCSEKESHA